MQQIDYTRSFDDYTVRYLTTHFDRTYAERNDIKRSFAWQGCFNDDQPVADVCYLTFAIVLFASLCIWTVLIIVFITYLSARWHSGMENLWTCSSLSIDTLRHAFLSEDQEQEPTLTLMRAGPFPFARRKLPVFIVNLFVYSIWYLVSCVNIEPKEFAYLVRRLSVELLSEI